MNTDVKITISGSTSPYTVQNFWTRLSNEGSISEEEAVEEALKPPKQRTRGKEGTLGNISTYTHSCREVMVGSVYTRVISEIISKHYRRNSDNSFMGIPSSMAELPYTRIERMSEGTYLSKKKIETLTQVIDILLPKDVYNNWWNITRDSLEMSGTSFTQSMLSCIFWIWEYFIIIPGRYKKLFELVNLEEVDVIKKREMIQKYLIETNNKNNFVTNSDSFWGSVYIDALPTFKKEEVVMLSLLPTFSGMSAYSREIISENPSRLYVFYKKYSILYSKKDIKKFPPNLQNVINAYKLLSNFERKLKNLGLLSSEIQKIIQLVTNPELIPAGGDWYDE